MQLNNGKLTWEKSTGEQTGEQTGELLNKDEGEEEEEEEEEEDAPQLTGEHFLYKEKPAKYMFNTRLLGCCGNRGAYPYILLFTPITLNVSFVYIIYIKDGWGYKAGV